MDRNPALGIAPGALSADSPVLKGLCQQFAISCLWTNEVLVYDVKRDSLAARCVIETRNEHDVLHSLRATPFGWLLSSSYSIYKVSPDFSESLGRWSHPRLSNVHSADWLGDDLVVVANTGLDELLLLRLCPDGDTVLEARIDIAQHYGLPPLLPVMDRRAEPRVRASQDNTHVNCATPFTWDGKLSFACCLFHQNDVVIVDAATGAIVDVIANAGQRIHSAWIRGREMQVSSSADAGLRSYDLDTHRLMWEWTAPGPVWTRSAKYVERDAIVFAGERPREANDSGGGSYVALLDTATGTLRWKLDLSDEGPFDVEPVDSSRFR